MTDEEIEMVKADAYNTGYRDALESVDDNMPLGGVQTWVTEQKEAHPYPKNGSASRPGTRERGR